MGEEYKIPRFQDAEIFWIFEFSEFTKFCENSEKETLNLEFQELKNKKFWKQHKI